jgi:hypothetical protein
METTERRFSVYRFGDGGIPEDFEYETCPDLDSDYGEGDYEDRFLVPERYRKGEEECVVLEEEGGVCRTYGFIIFRMYVYPNYTIYDLEDDLEPPEEEGYIKISRAKYAIFRCSQGEKIGDMESWWSLLEECPLPILRAGPLEPDTSKIPPYISPMLEITDVLFETSDISDAMEKWRYVAKREDLRFCEGMRAYRDILYDPSTKTILFISDSTDI